MTADRFDLPPEIDAAIPYSGPCGLCGGIEARHRVLDTIVERIRAGEYLAAVAWDYNLSVPIVLAIGVHWDDIGERWTR